MGQPIISYSLFDVFRIWLIFRYWPMFLLIAGFFVVQANYRHPIDGRQDVVDYETGYSYKLPAGKELKCVSYDSAGGCKVSPSDLQYAKKVGDVYKNGELLKEAAVTRP